MRIIRSKFTNYHGKPINQYLSGIILYNIIVSLVIRVRIFMHISESVYRSIFKVNYSIFSK